jgi:GDP/GTP exchange factor required for growth at low temperature
MNAFLPPTFLPPNPPRAPEPVAVASPPPPSTSKDGARSPPSRKLRKTRSNPQMPVQSPPSADNARAQPAYTGRGHSQSVTAADLPRFSVGRASAAPMPAPPSAPPAPRVDLFAEVMHWQRAPTSPLSSSSAASYSSRSRSTSAASADERATRAQVDNPFGARVHFDSPSRPLAAHLHVPVLREVQSFESGLTARAEPAPRRAAVLAQASGSASGSGKGSPTPSETPSAPSTPSIASAPFTPRPGSVDRGYTPTMETLMYTQYSTEVFDVLQTYRGLPLLEKLLPDSTETTVIKMSLTADERATPRDDPRFIIWGEVLPDDVRVGTGTDRSSSRSGRRSTKGSDDRPEHLCGARAPAGNDAPEKILLAATIERWIAQLTSELNYDELLVFFMTYRTYIRPVDLCHLLICRLHWALGQHSGEHDEMVRQIVRVRTFVAMRYWLLTFFEVDFIPNRELRLLIAGWLNALKKDPILQKHHDAPVGARSYLQCGVY